MMTAGFGLALLLLFGIIFVIGILGSIFWIWMLIDCLTKEPDQGNSKLVWVIVIFFLHFIGAAIYYFVRRPERISTYGR
jgi:sterol desaturase/sphingolipid hydroxylase (fatty acid hydroxylase superfamily)